MLVFDAHCDSPSQMIRLRDFSKDNEFAQVDFPKMLKGGIGASFFALFIQNWRDEAQAREYAYSLLDELDMQMAKVKDIAAYAYSAEELKMNYAKGLISVLIGLENGTPIGRDISMLKKFYDRGVRYITLAHGKDNEICDSCAGNGRWGGLSPFGREVVAEMNRLGMMIDVAHCSDKVVADCLESSSKPIAFTHGACRALSAHRRNLPDNLIKALADKGGVIGISIYPCFISEEFCKVLENSGLEEKMYIEDRFIANPSDEKAALDWINLQKELLALPRPSVKRVVDNIDHAVKVGGIDHVSIGTDYDGIEVMPEGMEDISKLGMIFDEMKARSYSDDEIEKVAGLNLLRVLEEQK